MEKYHKIQTVFKRDMTNKGRIIETDWSWPEFQYLRNNVWVFTEKIDGTNIRVEWVRNLGINIGGRTDNAQIPAFLYKRLVDLLPLNKLDNAISTNDADMLTLYGEGYGARIQKRGGKYISDGVDFILFDVMVGGWWLKRVDVEDIARKLGISVVPIVGAGTLDEGIKMVKNGLNSGWGDFPAEGIVMKPEIELKTRAGHRIITKIKHKDFNP